MTMTGTTKLRPDMSRKEAVRAFYAMRERLNLAEGELEHYKKLIAHLVDIVEIQLQDGNWNYNDYMRGMANGLLLAKTIMTQAEVYEPLAPPEKWIEENR